MPTFRKLTVTIVIHAVQQGLMVIWNCCLSNGIGCSVVAVCSRLSLFPLLVIGLREAQGSLTPTTGALQVTGGRCVYREPSRSWPRNCHRSSRRALDIS